MLAMSLPRHGPRTDPFDVLQWRGTCIEESQWRPWSDRRVTISPDLQALIEDSPDLVMAVRRDGTLLAHHGGRKVVALVPDKNSFGRVIGEIWPSDAATLLKALCRKSIDSRELAQSSITVEGMDYEIRASATGPDRIICTVSPGNPRSRSADPDAAEAGAPLEVGCLSAAVNQALALAALKELPAALLMLELDGIDAVARLDAKLAEEVSSRVLLRARHSTTLYRGHMLAVGAFAHSQLAVVLDVSDRGEIENIVTSIRAEIRRPVHVGQDSWHLDCYAGVSLLGRDANAPKDLLAMARIAAGEARRCGAERPQFFSDTMKLKSIARLDIAAELRNAVHAHALGMRYLGRYELLTGRLDTLVGYVTWQHPMRGRVSPTEFLSVAEATGIAVMLSREMLDIVRADILRGDTRADDSVRFSYGPLRHHLLHDDFLADIETFLSNAAITPERFEVRIAERTFLAIEPRIIDALAQLGTRVVIDEVGRSMGSVAKMASLPLWGMQLDRASVEDLNTEPAAFRLCRASIVAASALQLASIATGIDDDATLKVLLESGCGYGCGDLFERIALESDLAAMTVGAA